MRDFFSQIIPGFVYSEAQRKLIDRYYEIIAESRKGNLSESQIKKLNKEFEALIKLSDVKPIHDEYKKRFFEKRAEEEMEKSRSYGKEQKLEFSVHNQLSSDAPFLAQVAFYGAQIASNVSGDFSKPALTASTNSSARDLVTRNHQQQSGGRITLPIAQLAKSSTKPASAQNPISSSSGTYLESATKTVGEALSWLGVRSGNAVPYAIFAITSALSKSPAAGLLSAAAVAATLPQADAVMLGDKDYKTTVFCGPDLEVECELVKGLGEKSDFKFMKYNAEERIGADAERLILTSHGFGGGKLMPIPGVNLKPDFFANEFFPEVKVIHAVACFIGLDSRQNFQQNSLKENQVLFLHASRSLKAGISYEIISHLTAESNNYFPESENTQIVCKHKGETIIAEFTPRSLDTIIKSYIGASAERIYDSIVHNLRSQRESILRKFEKVDGETKSRIIGELDRLGIVNRAYDQDPEIKKNFVKDYLTKLLIPTIGTEASSKYLNILLSKNLIDVNYALKNGMTLAYSAAFANDHQFLEALGKAGADFNLANKNGLTPVIIAAQENHPECLKVLKKYGADLNAFSSNGSSPLYMAAQSGNAECLRIIKEDKVNLNKVASDGSSSVFVAAQNGHYKCLEILSGADFNLANANGISPLLMAIHKYKTADKKEIYEKTIITLIENGANPEAKSIVGTAYYNVRDADLMLKMRDAHELYKSAAKPDSSPAGKSHKALDVKSLEQEL